MSRESLRERNRLAQQRRRKRLNTVAEDARAIQPPNEMDGRAEDVRERDRLAQQRRREVVTVAEHHRENERNRLRDVREGHNNANPPNFAHPRLDGIDFTGYGREPALAALLAAESR